MTLSPKAISHLMTLPPGCYARRALGIDGATVKRRKAVGTGEHCLRKAWARDMGELPGIFRPWHLINSANERDQWARIKRTKFERGTMHLIVREHFHRNMPPLPVAVTITRYGPKVLDGDGMACSAKGVRDGIADAWGKGTNDRDGLHFIWNYAQERCKYHGVRVVITAYEKGNP